MIHKKLNEIYRKSKKINIDDNFRMVIMSDCHRGIGNNNDNFFKNKNIFKAALNYYYKNNYMYIELGDGDDLLECKNYKDVINTYLDIFKYLKKFHDKSKLVMIYGNHDIKKKDKKFLEDNLYKYYDEKNKKDEILLSGLIAYESLILEYKAQEIFLIHGHQVDILNGLFLSFSKVLVKYLWRILEFVGANDPTEGAKNNEVIKKVEKRLESWGIKNNKIVISGHTHRAVLSKVGYSLYFNDGCCIHPNGITCLEIENGKIALIKWELDVNDEGDFFVKRKILSGSEKLLDYVKWSKQR